MDGLEGAEGIHVKVSPVGYVQQLDKPYLLDSYGWLPDPILSFMNSMNVLAGDAQTLWVSVDVSKQANPGIYEGAVVIKPAGEPSHSVPFEVKVWDIELPKMSYLPVVLGMVSSQHYDYLLEHRINPSCIYNWYGILLKDDKENKPISDEEAWRC